MSRIIILMHISRANNIYIKAYLDMWCNLMFKYGNGCNVVNHSQNFDVSSYLYSRWIYYRFWLVQTRWSNARQLHILNIKENDQINLWLTQFGSPSAVNSILICYKSQRRRKNVVVPFMCTTIEMCCSTKFTTLRLCLGLWYMLYWFFLETIRARYSWSNMHKVITIPCIK